MTDQHIEELRRESDRHREAIARDVDLVTDRVAPNRIADRQKAKLRQGVGGIRDSLFGTADRHRSAVGSDDSLAQRASDTLGHARHAAPDAVNDFTEGNPLAAGLIGVGIGLLAATLMPTSREEQRVVDRAQEALDDTAAQIAEAGRQAAEAVKPEVMEAVEDVKVSARKSADVVAGDAKGAAEDVRESASSQARQLNDDRDPSATI